MLPSEFIKKHNIKLAKHELELCKKGMRKMVKSIDSHHDASHIHRLLRKLDLFIHTDEFSKKLKDVDIKNIFIAILWHDVWKSTRETKSIPTLLWHMIWEGIGASRIFAKNAKKAGLDNKTIKKIKYIIKKHSDIRFLPIKTRCAKILYDIDRLDHFSWRRLELIEKKYLVDRPIRSLYARLAKFCLKFYIERKNKVNLFFDWTEKEINKRKRKYLKIAKIGIKEYETMLKLLKNKKQKQFEEFLNYMRKKYVKKQNKLDKFF